MDLFHQVVQQRVILQHTAVNTALCWKERAHVFVIVLETGLAHYQSAEVCKYIIMIILIIVIV